MPRRSRLLVLWLIGALVGAGCGYALVQPHSSAAGQALRVGAVSNRTAQAEAGGVFAAALRGELAARGRLGAESSGSPVLEAELLALRSAPSALGAATAPAFRLEADLRLRIRDGAQVLYEDGAGGGEDYLAGVDVLGTEANRRAALRRLATLVAREAVERLEISARFDAR